MKRVVLLHGVGSSGAEMLGLARSLGVTVPAHAPDGPLAFDMGPGRQFFSVAGITEENRPERLAKALPGLLATIRSYGPSEDTVLVGFSQGAILSLHAAAAGLPLAGVVAIAGRLAGPVAAQPVWPPITMIAGTQDRLMPPRIAQATEGWLRAAGADPRLHVLDGLGHGIDARVLEIARAALVTV